MCTHGSTHATVGAGNSPRKNLVWARRTPSPGNETGTACGGTAHPAGGSCRRQTRCRTRSLPGRTRHRSHRTAPRHTWGPASIAHGSGCMGSGSESVGRAQEDVGDPAGTAGGLTPWQAKTQRADRAPRVHLSLHATSCKSVCVSMPRQAQRASLACKAISASGYRGWGWGGGGGLVTYVAVHRPNRMSHSLAVASLTAPHMTQYTIATCRCCCSKHNSMPPHHTHSHNTQAHTGTRHIMQTHAQVPHTRTHTHTFHTHTHECIHTQQRLMLIPHPHLPYAHLTWTRTQTGFD